MKRTILFCAVLMLGAVGPMTLTAQVPPSSVPRVEEKPHSLIGKWRWVESQVVTVNPDFTFKSGKGRKGTWKWKEGTERTYILSWDDGLYIDEVTVTSDGKKLSGRNNNNKKIKAERIAE